MSEVKLSTLENWGDHWHDEVTGSFYTRRYDKAALVSVVTQYFGRSTDVVEWSEELALDVIHGLLESGEVYTGQSEFIKEEGGSIQLNQLFSDDVTEMVAVTIKSHAGETPNTWERSLVDEGSYYVDEKAFGTIYVPASYGASILADLIARAANPPVEDEDYLFELSSDGLACAESVVIFGESYKKIYDVQLESLVMDYKNFYQNLEDGQEV